MSVPLETVLDYRTLTGVVNSKKGGIPADILPPGFMAMTRPVPGNTASFLRVQNTRAVAKRVAYGNPSKARAYEGVTEVAIKLLHTFEHQDHNMTVLTALRNYENEGVQMRGRQEVARQTGEMRRLVDNLRLACIYSIFRDGKIYFGSDGEILNSSTGAAETVDFAIPAAHQEQLGGIIAANWDIAATDIIGQVRGIKTQARKDYGAPLRHAFYGSNIPGYFLGNTGLKSLINGSVSLSDGFAASEIPNGFLGFQWHPISEAFFEDYDTGSDLDFLLDDRVVFTPEPDRDWWEVYEGSFEVPTALNIGSDAEGILSNFATVNGKFSYAAINSFDPPSLRQFVGDTFLPVLKAPSAIFIAETVSGSSGD